MQKLHATADAESLTQRAAQLLAAGRIGAARPLLSAARQLTPDSVGVAELSARLALRAGATDSAIIELDAAIEAAPEHPGLRKSRAELRRSAGDLDGATRDAAEAVILDRSDPTAKALLGVLMLDLGRNTDAIACLAEAVAAEPGNPGFAEGLAAAQEASGDSDAALATLEHHISVAPGLTEPRNAAILLCVRRRDFQRAVSLAEATRRAGIADACSFGLMGHALSSLARHADATDAYAEALKLGPHDPYVRHLVSAAGILPGASRAPVEYLRAVFDGYAERFEQHLISLGYRLPGLFRAVLQRHPGVASGEHVGPVLDLGCGTGMVGLAIADLPVGPLIGVDISPRMLARAAAKRLYAELREADVMDVLNGMGNAASSAMGGAHPLILAADVFCYFGDLQPLLAAAQQILTPGGWLVFSVEELLPDHDGMLPGGPGTRWTLHRQGRYAHGIDYVRHTAAAAGFRVLSLDRETTRFEADAPVAGLLVVLQRTRHAN